MEIFLLAPLREIATVYRKPHLLELMILLIFMKKMSSIFQNKRMVWLDFKRTCPRCSNYISKYKRACPNCGIMVKNIRGKISIAK
jgi:ribosomal protein S27AE